MHVIIALLCFFILLSISPTARRLTAVVVFFGIVAYALHCNETGGTKSIPITTVAQAAGISGVGSNERTKDCETQKGLRCLNLKTTDETFVSPLIARRTASSVKRSLPVEHIERVGHQVPNGPPGPYFVDNNGSLMQVIPTAHNTVDVIYIQPRQGLRGLVAPGTLYLHGQWHEGELYAVAHVFSAHCGPTPYPVSGGPESGDIGDGSLVLMGPAPLVDPVTCRITQWIWSDNSVITFTLPK